MSRGGSAVRQYRLMQLIERRRAIGVRAAADELGCNFRTVYRDLEVLQEAGYPVYQDRDGRRSLWRFVDGYRHEVKLALSWSEMLALTTGSALLESMRGTVFHEAAVQGLEKLRASLPQAVVARADAASRAVSASAGPDHDYRHRGNIVRTLIDAIDGGQTIELTYRKPGAAAAEARRVDPYHLHVQASALYLIGYCHERRAQRTFLVDRAQSVALTGERFVRRAEIDVLRGLHGLFGPWSGEPQHIRLRFNAEAAPFAAEARVHPSQTSQWASDGTLDVELDAPMSPSLLAWLVGFGPRVHVASPSKLRAAVLAEHAEATAQAAQESDGSQRRVSRSDTARMHGGRIRRATRGRKRADQDT